MSITMTDGTRAQVLGDHETVRRRILEAQGWKEGKPKPQREPEPDKRDMETQILDGVEALAPEAVKAAKEVKRTRKPTKKDDLPTL